MQCSSAAFASLIAPHSVEDFFHDYWEQKPLVIKGNSPFSSLYSYAMLKDAVQALSMKYCINLNVCKCVDNEKQMLEPNPTDVSLFEVEQYFKKHKATFQVLQPQQHAPNVASLISNLESFFGCLVGSNVYITPPSSKGLAPHYGWLLNIGPATYEIITFECSDDVEVFVVQLEGQKSWKIHQPLHELPNSCSGDLPLEIIGDPVLEVTLDKGDVMYFPRGWIHHAETGATSHSTHITISTYQKHSYGDLLDIALPIALKAAAEENIDFRKGIPRAIFYHAGLPHVEMAPSTTFSNFSDQSEKLLSILSSSMGEVLHEAIDIMSVDFIESRLPPTEEHLEEVMNGHAPLENDGCYGPFPDTVEYRVRLVDPNLIRLVIDSNDSSGSEDFSESELEAIEFTDQFMEEEEEEEEERGSKEDKDEDAIPSLVAAPGSDSSDDDDDMAMRREEEEEAALLFFCNRNEASQHMGMGERDNSLRFSVDLVPAIIFLIQSHPKLIQVKDIPRVSGQNIESIHGLVVALWSSGILISTAPSKKRKSNKTKSTKNKKRKLK